MVVVVMARGIVIGFAWISMLGASAQQDLTFSTTGAQTVALSQLRGKVVVLMFAGIQDPQCRDEFKALGSLIERYRGKQVNIYWVSVNPPGIASEDRLRALCGPAGPVPILLDVNQAAFKRLAGPSAQLPTLVILDQSGKLHGRPRGGFNPDSDFVNQVAAIIDELLERK
jgi:thiol-disulfide isomerase/thioredoxin